MLLVRGLWPAVTSTPSSRPAYVPYGPLNCTFLIARFSSRPCRFRRSESRPSQRASRSRYHPLEIAVNDLLGVRLRLAFSRVRRSKTDPCLAARGATGGATRDLPGLAARRAPAASLGNRMVLLFKLPNTLRGMASVQSPAHYLIQLARRGVSRCLIQKLAGFSLEP